MLRRSVCCDRQDQSWANAPNVFPGAAELPRPKPDFAVGLIIRRPRRIRASHSNDAVTLPPGTTEAQAEEDPFSMDLIEILEERPGLYLKFRVNTSERARRCLLLCSSSCATRRLSCVYFSGQPSHLSLLLLRSKLIAWSHLRCSQSTGRIPFAKLRADIPTTRIGGSERRRTATAQRRLRGCLIRSPMGSVRGV